MNILIVYPEPVFPVNSGGRARAWHIANYLSQNNKVTLLSLYWGINKDKKTKINNNFLYIEEMNKSYFVNRNWIRFLKYSKLSKYFRYNKEYIFFPSCLKLLKSFNADLIICNHSFMFLNCWLGKKNKIPIILDQQNVESEINKNLKFWEMFALKRANFITSCSPVDMDKMIKLFPRTENKIELIENGVDIKKAKNTVINRKAVREKLGLQSDDFVLCFHGCYDYDPNKKAYKWIYNNLNFIKNVKILLFGRNCHKKRNKNIINLGCIDNPFEYIKACDVAIVPLLFGSGTRIKILEYLACGLPVISTLKGAEGLEVKNNKNIIIEKLDNFKKAIFQLISDQKKQKDISNGGYKLVCEKYDWNIILEKLDLILNKI